MSRALLQQLIEDFDAAKLSRFFREKNRDFVPKADPITIDSSDEFSEGHQIGEIELSDGRFVVAMFSVSKPLSERSGKKAQYELAKRILKDSQKDAGIFVFYDADGNFRFSLVYTVAVGRGRRKWSDFRRSTYFVSPELTNKTFLQRIGDGDVSTLESIRVAFSVEQVSNKFFDEFRKRFEETKTHFEEQNKNTVCLWLKDRYGKEEYNEQINKLIFSFLGRLIFIYFLQRKGWIENRKDYLRKIIEDSGQTNLYYDFFEPLFFEVFSKKEQERSEEIRKQYTDTPYLNGGLFERSELEDQLQKEGMFMLFDDDFIRELILEFFEAYNFTVDENSPDDHEVSIDPEMLGKVFENTLAEEERGKKGTFYTPREIVQYMVRDSLQQFLKNETNIDQQKLKRFIFDSEFDLEKLTKAEIRALDKKLEAVKVLDPAVGSAAFPVEMMQMLVDFRKRLNVSVGKNINEVTLKKAFIKNNLYGVDIDPSAIEIAKLRLWLSLIVEYDKSEAEPLPNLDFQFRLGNSLQEKIGDLDVFRVSNEGRLDLAWDEGFEKLKREMLQIKDRFYGEENEEKKKALKHRFDALEHKIILERIKDLEQQWRAEAKAGAAAEKKAQKLSEKIEALKERIKDGTYKLFKPDFHFSEVFDRKDDNGERIGGFDVVIGNPPYGVKVANDIKDEHGLGSRDSYGVFISTSFKRFLKPGGVLSFIVSDTWLTIKTHKPLREQVLGKTLHSIVQVHKDCFDATVNACVLLVTNAEATRKHKLIAADLTNISTRTEMDELRPLLRDLPNHVGSATPRYAVYSYVQELCSQNSNFPIFVGSPKLFVLMNDTTCERKEGEVAGRKVKIRQVGLNGKSVELVRFGDIAEAKVGLQTGDNTHYLFQNPSAHGNYRDVGPYKKHLLSDKELEKIAANDELRRKVVDRGFHKSKDEDDFDSDLWLGGKYIVPYDKGGASDTESGWLPNYYVPTDYFINWSQASVRRLRTLRHRSRNGSHGASLAAVIRNPEFYFRPGLTFSDSGIYAPTFRVRGSGLFDQKSSIIASPNIDPLLLLGVLCSIAYRALLKNYVNHSVSSHVEDISTVPVPRTALIDGQASRQIRVLVERIIRRQQSDPHYDFISNEQKEIDELIYKLYGFNKDDIREVETWYARRYPKLAKYCDI